MNKFNLVLTALLLVVLAAITPSCGSGGGGDNTSANTAPIANAGPDRYAVAGTLVTLNGSGSTDADGDTLTYSWLLTLKPASSTATLSSTTVSNPAFTADKDGTYALNLIVNDGTAASAVSTVTITALTPVPGKMPDTNQTQSYTPTFGEDHDYAINPPAYIDNDDGTITDVVTGLLWQKQADGKLKIWADALAYCDNLILGGHADLRLPSRTELVTLIDNGTSRPAINTTYFPNTIFPITVTSNYWSSTPYAPSASYAWGVDFISGYTVHPDKSAALYARCVQGAQAAPQSFTDNGNGTITDNVTLLMWEQNYSGPMKWEAALATCETSTVAGYTDWRLPNHKELLSLYDDTRYDPPINPLFIAAPWVTWSSTTSDVAYAWAGGTIGDDGTWIKTENYMPYVRCVRGGQ